MMQEGCVVPVVGTIRYCAFGADWWLFVGCLIAAVIIGIQACVGAKALRRSRRFGTLADGLRSDAGAVVLALGGGLGVGAWVAWPLHACSVAGALIAGAVDGLVALGILAVVRAIAARGSCPPAEPPPERHAVKTEPPLGMWCPPASAANVPSRALATPPPGR